MPKKSNAVKVKLKSGIRLFPGIKYAYFRSKKGFSLWESLKLGKAVEINPNEWAKDDKISVDEVMGIIDKYFIQTGDIQPTKPEPDIEKELILDDLKGGEK